MAIRVSSRSIPGRRSKIESFSMKDFAGGWRPDKPLSRLEPNELSDVLNLEYEAAGAVRKRGGFEEYTDAVTGLDNIEFIFAPRVFTVGGGASAPPILGQEVMVFAKADGELYQQVFGTLEEDFLGDAGGADLVDTGNAMGPASAQAFNHFRVWPLSVVVFKDKIYTTTLRYGASSDNGGTDETESGAGGASKPLRYDAQNDAFSFLTVTQLDGTSSRFPRARTAISYHNRVFAANLHSAGNYRYPARIYWSEPDDAETWEANSYIEVGGDEGTEITSLLPFGEQILIFKNLSVYALVGTDEDTFALYPLSRKLGTDCTYGTTEGNGAAYFFDNTSMSIWKYDGARFTDIGQVIAEHIRQNINYNAMHKAVLQIFDNYLWFSFPKGDVDTDEDDENTETLVFDLRNGAWTRWDFGVVPSVWHRYSDYQVDAQSDTVEGDSNPYFCISDATQDDHIMKGYMGNVDTDANTIWTDNGSNYTLQFRTGWFSPDNGMERKRIRRLELLTEQNSDQIDVILYRDFINATWSSFNFDPLADTTPDYLEYHMQQSSVDVNGLFNWMSVDVQATHANEAQINGIGCRYSFRKSPRGDVGGSAYHE